MLSESQRVAFRFFRARAQDEAPFSAADVERATGWGSGSFNTYKTKHLKDYVTSKGSGKFTIKEAVESDFRTHAHDQLALVPLARRAAARDLVDYIERVQRYASPGPVDEAEARSRIHDLARCRPPAEVVVARRGDQWLASTDDDDALVIDARTGAMRIEAP